MYPVFKQISFIQKSIKQKVQVDQIWQHVATVNTDACVRANDSLPLARVCAYAVPTNVFRAGLCHHHQPSFGRHFGTAVFLVFHRSTECEPRVCCRECVKILASQKSKSNPVRRIGNPVTVWKSVVVVGLRSGRLCKLRVDECPAAGVFCVERRIRGHYC